MVVRRIPLRQARRVLTQVAPPRSRAFVTTTTTTTTTIEAEQAAVAQDAGEFPVSRPNRRRYAPAVAWWNENQRIERVTRRLGAIPNNIYSPLDVLLDPPKPEDVTLQMLMAAQTHMGHHKSLWNPHNTRYIYGIRQGIHIISLEQTAAHLRRAARVVEDVAYRGGIILFAGTRKGHMPIVAKAADLAGACQLFTKWTPGTITNRDLILNKQALKAVDEHDQQVSGFDIHLLEQKPLMPDLVVCLNPLENFVMLYECGLKSIPTIGVIDTNANPSWVTYAIPANDDSLRSLAVIAGVLGRAGQAGRERRLKRAKEEGSITWQMSRETLEYLRRASRERRTARELAETTGQEESLNLYADSMRKDEKDDEAALLGIEEESIEFSQEDVLDAMAEGQREHIKKLDNIDDLGETSGAEASWQPRSRSYLGAGLLAATPKRGPKPEAAGKEVQVDATPATQTQDAEMPNPTVSKTELNVWGDVFAAASEEADGVKTAEAPSISTQMTEEAKAAEAPPTRTQETEIKVESLPETKATSLPSTTTQPVTTAQPSPKPTQGGAASSTGSGSPKTSTEDDSSSKSP